MPTTKLLLVDAKSALQIAAAILGSMIIVRGLPPTSAYIEFMQSIAWLVGP